MIIPLSAQWITERDEAAVLAVLRSTYLSLGPRVPAFEAALASLAGVHQGVAVNSGTSALHLLVRALGLGPGDDVLTTPFSFIASANCLLFEGVRPVFVDIRSDTYNMDAARLEAALTPRTKGILAVDAFGQPAELDTIQEFVRRHGLCLIEDSCESLGSVWKGRPCGSWGNAGVFAFYPNKQITTGEGGCIVTDVPEVARLCRSMRNQGRGEDDDWLGHERLGYNYRISDINCALGLSQLERLDTIIQRRAQVAAWYHKRLAGHPAVVLPSIAPEVTHMSWFVYVIRLADRFSMADRDAVIERLADRGIQTRRYFTPIHLQRFYVRKFGYAPGDFPVTEHVAQRTVALPFFTMMTEEQVDYVARSLDAVIGLVAGKGRSVSG